MRESAARHEGAGVDQEAPSVAITGSTGFLGEPLVRSLREAGYRVIRISRSAHPDPGSIRWDPRRGVLEGARLEGLHAVVHLAGEPLPGLRWTPQKKERILRSREEGTRLLSGTLAELRRPPRVLLSASAVGYYGNRGNEPLSESSSAGDGFLADVCRRWEGATHAARALGIRTVHLRTGLVLSYRGGLLETILLPFRLGVGGRLGSGRQYMSWIDLDDAVGLIGHAMEEPEIRGPMNVTAPGPVPNATFADVLGRVLGRPTLLPVPAIAIRSLLGEMGEELLLFGQRAFPERALSTGYQFRFTDLEDSLRKEVG